MSDILRELSDEELNDVLKQLKEKLPYAIRDYYFIQCALKFKENAINFSDVSVKCLPKFYTHKNGNKDNCTVFAVTGNEDHTVSAFTFEKSLNELKECFDHTKFIKWEQGVLVVLMHAEQIDVPLQTIMDNGANFAKVEKASYYWMTKEEAQHVSFAIHIPDNTLIKNLTEHHAKTCNDMWQWRYSNSENYIRSMILLNGGYGLFDQKTNELLAFALINDHLATGLLNVIEHCRGKGYGELMARYLTIKIAEMGLHPTCYIDAQNTVSQKLYNKIGYNKIGDINWITVAPKCNYN
ncbi:unnamed protein product [Diamesa hyperborea]